MIERLKEDCLYLQLGLNDKQINELIEISKEDLIERFGFYSEENLYQLSLSTIKLSWCRFIKQYSNNPLNETIDVDSYISEEKIKRSNILSINGTFKIAEHGLIPFAKRGEQIICEDGSIEIPIIDIEVKPFEECSEDQLNEFKLNGFVEIKN